MPEYLPARFKLNPLDSECYSTTDDGVACRSGAYSYVELNMEGPGEIVIGLCIQHLKSFSADLTEPAGAESGALESEASRMIEHINEQMRATQRGDEQ